MGAERPTIPDLFRHKWFKSAEPTEIVVEEKERPILEELSLDGLKTPRHQQMLSPRQGDNVFEDGIRPSPRAPMDGNKQTKIGKFIHSVRKGFGATKQKK